MNAIKITKAKESRNTMVLILLILGVLFFALAFFVQNKDLKFTLFTISAALVAAIFITSIFKESFGNKKTLEEIEESQFGKK